ncbi:MAG: protein translocase subunit SecF [Minicystis sp.]
MEFIKPGRQFDFMRWRWRFIGASLLLLVLSVISFIVPGPKLGTDFKGGTELEVAFKAAVSAGEVRAAVEHVGFDAPEVVSVADKENPNRFLIRVQEVTVLSDKEKSLIREKMCLIGESGQAPAGCAANASATEIKFSPGGDKIFARYESRPDLATIKQQLTGVEGLSLRAGANNPLLASERDNRVEIQLKSKGDQLLDGLRAQLGADKVPESALRVEWIGPKAGAQLRDAAIRSIAIACFFIMAYIAFRFDLRFAPGGIVALIHDVGIALGAMILARKEITLSTVAAMLTIVGYSITDTVVVYDRIRENLGKHRNMSFSAVINLSISEMLGRTIITSGVTALSLVAFLVWGTGALKDFAFALLVGILVGTYSSIYVAAPLTEWIDRRFFGASANQKKAITRTRAAKKAGAVV